MRRWSGCLKRCKRNGFEVERATPELSRGDRAGSTCLASINPLEIAGSVCLNRFCHSDQTAGHVLFPPLAPRRWDPLGTRASHRVCIWLLSDALPTWLPIWLSS